MNYLAHAYLSFQQPGIVVGNMISDFVKGKKKFDYSLSIQTGIALHRAIDEFTDSHPATVQAKQFFKPAYGLYCSVFMDVVYDYYLANDKTIFKEEDTLQLFSAETYQVLSDHEQQLPDNFRMIFPYMKSHDWLTNYQYHQGIRNSFRGLAHRAKYMTESDTAFAVFEKHHAEFHQYYLEFFPSVKDFAFHHLQLLQKI